MNAPTERRYTKHDANEYTAPPPGAEKKVGPNYFKRGVHGFIYMWCDEWVRYRGLTDKQFNNGDSVNLRLASISNVARLT